jgi:hypothetical protein
MLCLSGVKRMGQPVVKSRSRCKTLKRQGNPVNAVNSKD